MKLKINENDLYILCILSLFISRILVYFHFPSIINFLHFALLIMAMIISLKKGTIHFKDSMSGIMLLTTMVIILSTIINSVKPLNCILVLLILLEPFIIANSSINWKENYFVKIENILIKLSIINLLISYFQFFFLKMVDDDVTGIFFGMGSGAHINGAFSMITALYLIYYSTKKNFSKTRCILISLLLLFVVIMCDNKQSILAYGLAAIMLLILNSKNIKQTFITILLIAFGALIVYILTFSVLGKITTWTSKPDEIVMGMNAKFSFIENLDNFRTDNLTYLFGFGPGMSFSRIARMLPEYSSLDFLGTSISPINATFYNIYLNSWIMLSSSMWSFYFSWASIFGDLGIIGLLTIVALYFKFYKIFCSKTINKYVWAIIVCHGLIFDWLEEPAFVVSHFIIIILLNHDFSDDNRFIYKLLRGKK